MTKSFNKLKKPCFWPIFGPFPQILGQNFFFQKIRLCHGQLHRGFYHYAKIQKKLMMQFEITGQKDGRTDRPYFIGSFRLPEIQQEMLLTFMLYYSRSKINYTCLHWQSKIAKCSARLPFKNGGNLVMRFLNFLF